MTTPDTDRAGILRQIFDRIGSVETPMMGGDNLAVTLCSCFENPDQDACDETGWTEDAIKGHDEVLAAIRAHFQPLADLIEQDGRTIEALREEVDELTTASPYCSICGSCGDINCGCTRKCIYAHSHPDVERDLAKAEAEREALRAEIARQREVIETWHRLDQERANDSAKS